MTQDPVTTEISKHNKVLLCSSDLSGLNICGSISAFCPDCDMSLLSEPKNILSTLRSDDYQVLMLDIDPPDCSAETILSEVRAHFLPEQLPILLLSSSWRASNDRIPDLGNIDLLSKPLQAIEIKLRLRNALSIRQCFEANRAMRARLELEVGNRTEKLNMLIDSGLMMAMEKSRECLFGHILREGQKLLHCDGATMYLMTSENTLRFAVRTRHDLLPFDEITLFDAETGQFNDSYVSAYVANHKTTILIDDVYEESRFDFSGTRTFDEKSGYHTISLLTVPMAPRNGSVLGVLQFINALDPNTGLVIPFPHDAVPLIEALAAQAAVALDNLQLIAAQKSTTESIIKVLAAAMDAKSPHTGHHCVRVPELAIMLAEAACKQTEGPLADFNFESEDQWFEFRVGAWLHDCGKITTPEFVIDKATKLDMLYNRIHEIRMRFEVLLRDAEIKRLNAVLSGGDPVQAELAYEQEKVQLQDDFAFIAECNQGHESIRDSDCAKIKSLSAKTWLRHFDDTLGLSHHESGRLQKCDRSELPVSEPLLSDKASHLVPRTDCEATDLALGIKMLVPEYMFNYGEIYNLSIGKGTLNDEERYKINEHIVETIKLLEKISFPDFLQRVPEYATTHHETLDGRGYPRRLTASELSIPSRIMAVADIFEAITASDRPYKKPYKLSESLSILRDMKNNRHIDPDIYELFLLSGVYKSYAKKYLKPEQIDEVDIADFLDETPKT